MRRVSVVFFAILFLLQIPSCVFAATVQLDWNANTESDLAGYKVYYGTSSGTYGTSIDVGNVVTYDINNLTDGSYFFALTAYDTSGNESGFSAEVPVSIDTTSPLSPGGVNATVKIP
jgi:hypothetical protein